MTKQKEHGGKLYAIVHTAQYWSQQTRQVLEQGLVQFSRWAKAGNRPFKLTRNPREAFEFNKMVVSDLWPWVEEVEEIIGATANSEEAAKHEAAATIVQATRPVTTRQLEERLWLITCTPLDQQSKQVITSWSPSLLSTIYKNCSNLETTLGMHWRIF